jgi:hypothetical protein
MRSSMLLLLYHKPRNAFLTSCIQNWKHIEYYVLYCTSLKDSNCLRQFSSYRATFELKQGQWTTVRLPWSRFEGFGWGAVENLLDNSALRRIGLVAIGKEMDVSFALSSIRFVQDQ